MYVMSEILVELTLAIGPHSAMSLQTRNSSTEGKHWVKWHSESRGYICHGALWMNRNFTYFRFLCSTSCGYFNKDGVTTLPTELCKYPGRIGQ